MALYRWLFVYGFLKGICDGCEIGTYLDNGDCRQCRTNCSSCIVESECVSCKAGFYGKSCSNKCPDSCHDLECDKESGLCLSCIKGYFINEKKMCDQCPDNCTTCNSKNYCFACKSGSKGTACEGECSSCKEGSSCDKNTGYCFESCKDGQSGELCDLSCNSNCLSCDRLNENNCTACARDRHGIACNETCPSACVNNTCNRTNGFCNVGCSSGYWGQMCNKACPGNCMNCEVKNGTCLKCANGFYGINCSVGQNNEFKTILLTVVSVGFVIIVAAIVACVVYMYIFRRKRMHTSGRCKNKDTRYRKTCAECRCFCFKHGQRYHETAELNMLSKADVNSPSSENSKNQITANVATEPCEERNLLEGEDSGHNDLKEDGIQLKGKKDNEYEKETQEVNQFSPSDGHTVDSDKDNIKTKSITYIDVDGYEKQARKYIASFGPITALTQDTSEKFWMDIWQKQCYIIVMLTDFKGAEELVSHFQKDQKHGKIRIAAGKAKSTLNRYTIALNMVNDSTHRRTITLNIFHYWSPVRVWCLSNRESLRTFYEDVSKSNADPIMVYCSEQIDRCGTFIAYDMLKTKGKLSDRIPDCVNYLLKKGIDMTKETTLLKELLSGI